MSKANFFAYGMFGSSDISTTLANFAAFALNSLDLLSFVINTALFSDSVLRQCRVVSLDV